MKSAPAAVLSLAQLLEQQPAAPPACLVEPGLLPAQGILFVGGEPKVGKSLPVANLALSPAAGADRIGFPIPAPRRVLVCQFELPVPQFVSRLATMRGALDASTDEHLLVDTRAAGHLLSAAEDLGHFLAAAKAASAQVIVLDPLYSAHDQDENDTRAMAALCQSLLRLRDASRAALVVVHHVRKSIGRHEIGSAFRGSSALHAVGDSYLLVTRPSPQLATVEVQFQFRYASPQPPRLLELNPQTLWFSSTAASPPSRAPRRKVDKTDVAPEWMLRADVTELAPKKSAATTLPCSDRAREGGPFFHLSAMPRISCQRHLPRRWEGTPGEPKVSNTYAASRCRCDPHLSRIDGGPNAWIRPTQTAVFHDEHSPEAKDR